MQVVGVGSKEVVKEFGHPRASARWQVPVSTLWSIQDAPRLCWWFQKYRYPTHTVPFLPNQKNQSASNCHVVLLRQNDHLESGADPVDSASAVFCPQSLPRAAATQLM